MSDCCSSDQDVQQAPKRHNCPVCNKSCLPVPYKTILQHIKTPWQSVLPEQPYYFCDNSLCDAVYFGLDNISINKDSMRTPVGIKENSGDVLICYCFDVTRSQAKFDDKIKQFVIEYTKNSLCACDIKNPSGRCCLKDFP